MKLATDFTPAQKAAEKTEKVIQLQAKREIKNYWSTAEQVEGMAELHNDCLIRMANSSDPETGRLGLAATQQQSCLSLVRRTDRRALQKSRLGCP